MAKIRVFYDPRNIKIFRNHEKSMEQSLPHCSQRKQNKQTKQKHLQACDIEIGLQTYEVISFA